MNADILIIGGGIAGVSLAARLAPYAGVTLLEAEPSLAHHASGRSAALYEPRYGSAIMVELSLASGPFFHAARGILSPRGLMMLGKPQDDAVFRAEAASMQMHDITLSEARDLVPPLHPDQVAMVAYSPHAWDIDTNLLIQGFARDARAAGARIVTDARVTDIARGAAGWQVETPAGLFHSTIVVNAAGAWVDQVARLAEVAPLGFTPFRRSMARVPAPDGVDVSRWPMMIGAGEAWYAKPDAGALIVSPAEEHLMDPHDAWADDMVLAEGIARYGEMVTTPVTRMLANWAGLRTFAPDRSMVIGPDADEPSFFWLAGQGGQGFQSAPAASRLAADLILGRTPDFGPDVLAALSPQRFR